MVYHIGQKDSENIEIFRKVEPYFDINEYILGRKISMDIQSRRLEEAKQSLRNHDKLNDDATLQLSDQQDCRKLGEDSSYLAVSGVR